MYHASTEQAEASSFLFETSGYESAPIIACNWRALRNQLLAQWSRLSAREIDKAGPNRRRLAVLIAHKYGVASEMIENYLRNFERTMPLPTQ